MGKWVATYTSAVQGQQSKSVSLDFPPLKSSFLYILQHYSEVSEPALLFFQVGCWVGHDRETLVQVTHKLLS